MNVVVGRLFERSGADGVAANAVFSVVDTDVTSKAYEAVLAAHVTDVSRSAAERGDRRDDGDDTALALSHHLAEGVLAGKIDAAVVDVVGPIPDGIID